jgi:citrate synthase
VTSPLLRLYGGFHHDAHPMAMVAAIVASMSAFYHDTTNIYDEHHIMGFQVF